jgi:hypothetical protein
VGQQVTASKIHQLLKCARPFAPDVELEEDDPGEPALYGSAAHELLDIIVSNGALDLEDAVNACAKWGLAPGLASELLAHVQDATHTLQKWLVKDNPWGEKFTLVDTEVHLAWNPITGKSRVVAFDEETHHYELLPGEIGGTYDLLVKSKNRVVVLDYKTGDYGIFHEPARHPQMRMLALMTKASSVAILHTPRGGVPPVVYADDIISDDEQDFLAQLRAAMARIGDGSLTPGKEQCKYCRAICIAKNASLVEDASKSVAMVLGSSPGGLAPRSAEDLGRFHMMLGDLKRLAEAARADLKARVLAGEVIERPDGKVLVIEEREYETVSKSSIVEALGKVGGEKLVTSLRKKGCLRVGVRQELHARK